MQIVIDIPEGLKRDFELEQWTALSCMEMKDALMKGTPLPKGHGDLVDISELMDMLCLEDNAYNRDNNVAELITLEDIDRLDVIVPADKEE